MINNSGYTLSEDHGICPLVSVHDKVMMNANATNARLEKQTLIYDSVKTPIHAIV
jgi:hypothetical protein